MPLDDRKARILHAIVNDYVTTAEPVGSDRLVSSYQFGCKSATIRNEMAEMSEQGYLQQPHTSAGRIPTDRGYRYFVDQLMERPPALPATDARKIRARFRRAETDVEFLVQQTCRLLSELTSYPSLATDPSYSQTTLRRVYVSAAGPRHALLVLLMSNGYVEHRLVEMELIPPENVLIAMANFITALSIDKDPLEIARVLAMREIPNELLGYAAPLNSFFAVLKQMAMALSEKRLFLEGTSQILRQPEFQDVRRLETLLNALEQRSALYAVLSRALLGTNVTIMIGVENDYSPMQECSVVTTSYSIGTRTAGYLGVVGPTRMDYPRASAAVRLMARNLSQMLTNLSLA